MATLNDQDQASSSASTVGVRQVTVGVQDAGQRLDNYLLAQLKGVPKSRIYRILRTGEVRVNKCRAKPMQRVVAGDVIRLPPMRLAEREAREIPMSRALALRERVLYEDDHLLVLNKPAGLAVHGGSGVRYGVIELARAAWGHLPGLELAHRLDRETSGCLILAKHREALLGVQRQWADKTTRKVYLALLKGGWRGGAYRVQARLRKNELQGGERVVRVDETGKDAVSMFEPVEMLAHVATLTRVTIETGRTHQIRVHAQSIRHPLAGDDKYGDDGFNRLMKGFGLRRLFLHAERLDMLHPMTECTLRLSAPLAEDLDAVLRRLREQ